MRTDWKHPSRAPRPGHGAASLIPHLNVELVLEPDELSDLMFADPAGDGKQPAERLPSS
jgi:hypothetical protein